MQTFAECTPYQPHAVWILCPPQVENMQCIFLANFTYSDS